MGLQEGWGFPWLHFRAWHHQQGLFCSAWPGPAPAATQGRDSIPREDTCIVPLGLCVLQKPDQFEKNKYNYFALHTMIHTMWVSTFKLGANFCSAGTVLRHHHSLQWIEYPREREGETKLCVTLKLYGSSILMFEGVWIKVVVTAEWVMQRYNINI